MKRILVTTDFSGNSKAGIRYAIQLAAKTGAELVFYHIIEVMKPTSWSDRKFDLYCADRHKKNLAKLEKFVLDIFTKDGMKVSKTVFITEVGAHNPASMIIDCARRHKADYICMSTRGAGKLKKLFGTVAAATITYSSIPLIIVPHGYRMRPVQTVFYASDMAVLAPELKLVKKFASAVNARVTVYHYDYMLHVYGNIAKLERQAKKHASPGVNFHFKSQDIAHSLADHLEKDVKKEKASLVVLFTKQNRNWFDKLFGRNEAREMAFNADVPLLIFRKALR